jgi:hypothetical protein
VSSPVIGTSRKQANKVCGEKVFLVLVVLFASARDGAGTYEFNPYYEYE